MYYLKIVLVNKTEEHTFAVLEEVSSAPNTHSLFVHLQRQWGKCSSNLFSEAFDARGDHKTVKCGWVFEKNDRYDGTSDLYVREAWVEVWKEDESGQRSLLSMGGVK